MASVSSRAYGYGLDFTFPGDDLSEATTAVVFAKATRTGTVTEIPATLVDVDGQTRVRAQVSEGAFTVGTYDLRPAINFGAQIRLAAGTHRLTVVW